MGAGAHVRGRRKIRMTMGGGESDSPKGVRSKKTEMPMEKHRPHEITKEEFQ